jgi:DNA-binding NarL/FixJ family response regulator
MNAPECLGGIYASTVRKGTEHRSFSTFQPTKRESVMSPYRIVLADDHIILRQGVKKIIEEHGDLQVIGEAIDGFELLDLLKISIPDMVILDISMPNLGGIEVAKEIKNLYSAVKILILTMHKKMEYVYAVLSAGVEGYLLKQDTELELFTAIETIRLGKTYVSSCFTSSMTEDLIQYHLGERKESSEHLTTREKEVLKLIAEGKSSKEIASLLFISVYTVNNHRANIIKKLKLKRTADLVRYAIDKGYIANPA